MKRRRYDLGLAGLGIELAAAVIGFTLLGLWIDRRYDTAPWAVVISASIGFVGGMYNFILSAQKAVRKAEARRSEARESEERAAGRQPADDGQPPAGMEKAARERRSPLSAVSGALAGLTLVLLAVGWVPTRSLAGAAALPAMLLACAVSFVGSAIGALPVATARAGGLEGLKRFTASVVLRLLLVAALAGAVVWLR